MRRTRLNSDVTPVSDFRANAAELIARVRNSRRPLLLTQRGRSAAVVLAVDEYDQLIEEIDTLRDIRTAEEQLERGQVLSNAKAKSRLRGRFRS